MLNPLFSTYRQGENRVTSTTLAVFERLEGYVLRKLLAGLVFGSELTYVEFKNQVPLSKSERVPDAQISANIHYLFEFKTKPESVDFEQLKGHLKHFKGNEAHERLIVISPDSEEPQEIAKLKDRRALWTNFKNFSQVITSLLESDAIHVSEQSVYLLKELRNLFAQDGLIDHNEIVVVAAKDAYPHYKKYNAYVCQADRKFKHGITHMGFYFEKSIQIEVPKIIAQRDQLKFDFSVAKALKKSRSQLDVRFAEIIETFLDEKLAAPGSTRKVFVLSPPNDPSTIKLKQKIENDQRDKNLDLVAWTMGQRYTSKASLTSDPPPKRTSEIKSATSDKLG